MTLSTKVGANTNTHYKTPYRFLGYSNLTHGQQFSFSYLKMHTRISYKLAHSHSHISCTTHYTTHILMIWNEISAIFLFLFSELYFCPEVTELISRQLLRLTFNVKKCQAFEWCNLFLNMFPLITYSPSYIGEGKVEETTWEDQNPYLSHSL